jgi:hypothetical protein
MWASILTILGLGTSTKSSLLRRAKPQRENRIRVPNVRAVLTELAEYDQEIGI